MYYTKFTLCVTIFQVYALFVFVLLLKLYYLGIIIKLKALSLKGFHFQTFSQLNLLCIINKFNLLSKVHWLFGIYGANALTHFIEILLLPSFLLLVKLGHRHVYTITYYDWQGG